MEVENLLHDHVELPHVLDLAVHQVNFFGWMGTGDHSETPLLLLLFYQSTPSCLKVMGWLGWVAHVIFVSAHVLWVLTFDLGLRLDCI